MSTNTQLERCISSDSQQSSFSRLSNCYYRRHSETDFSEVNSVCDREILQTNSLPSQERSDVASVYYDSEVVNSPESEISKLNSPVTALAGAMNLNISQTWDTFPTEGKVHPKLHSSNPDISADNSVHIQFDSPDRWTDHPDVNERSEEEHPFSNEKGKNTSNILSFLQKNADGDYDNGRKRHNYALLSRKFSMDSQLKFKQYLKNKSLCSKPSKRSIKLSHPDHTSVMYLSGADTLGGLPDDDSQQLHHLNLLTQYSATFFPRPILYRRSSCPVIFEGEESDDFSSPRKLSLENSSSDSNSHLPSKIMRGRKQNASDDDQQKTDKQRRVSKSHHFFVGSDSLEGSDDTKACATVLSRHASSHKDDPRNEEIKRRKSFIQTAVTSSSSEVASPGPHSDAHSRARSRHREANQQSSDKTQKHNMKNQQAKTYSNSKSETLSTPGNNKRCRKTKATDDNKLKQSMSATDSSGSIDEVDSSHYHSDVSSDA